MTVNKNWAPGKASGSERVEVTPEMAAAWLLRNAKNRKISPGQVEMLTEDLKAGRWLYDANPIRFNVNGELVDGQHRLSAIAQSGLKADCLVAWGLPENANKNIDSGRARTTKDVLTMRGGVANPLHVAAVAKLASSWDPKNKVLTRRYWVKSSSNQLVGLIESDPTIAEAVTWVNGALERRRLTSQTVTGFCLWVLRGLAGKKADEFFETTIAGAGLVSGDPRLALVKTMQRLSGRISNREDRFMAIAIIFKAWNAWRAGEKVTLLRWNSDEEFPSPTR